MQSTFPATSRQICRSCARRLQQTAAPRARSLSTNRAAAVRPPPTGTAKPSSLRLAKQTNRLGGLPTTGSIRSIASTAYSPATEPPDAPAAPASTHYDLFPESLPSGPPPHGPFSIDVRALRREFLQLQAGAHPDRHPASRKAQAEAMSAHINDAFRTLESPLLRAQYLLRLQGVDVASDETAKVEDMELLGTVLEAREAIEEAQEESELDGLRAENEARIAESEKELEAAFKAHDMERAKAEAVRLRYWVNIRDTIHGWEKGKEIVLQH